MTTFIDVRNAHGMSQKQPPRHLSCVKIKPYDVMISSGLHDSDDLAPTMQMKTYVCKL